MKTITSIFLYLFPVVLSMQIHLYKHVCMVKKIVYTNIYVENKIRVAQCITLRM